MIVYLTIHFYSENLLLIYIPQFDLSDISHFTHNS